MLGVTSQQLALLTRDAQRELMLDWFRSHYEDPAVRTPYDSEDGGYVYVGGGPFDAAEELREEFEGFVPDDVIDDVVNDLNGESAEWAPVPSAEEYDEDLFDVVRANNHPLANLRDSLKTNDDLLQLAEIGSLEKELNGLLFANVITVLETYLSDTFINRVLTDSVALRQFIASTPEFKKQQVPYSEIFSAVARADDEAKKYLLDVVWHNVSKVQAMYRDTFGVGFGSAISVIAKAVPKRHDIVHRNGKSRDGIRRDVATHEVRELSAAVLSLAEQIDKALASRDAAKEGHIP